MVYKTHRTAIRIGTTKDGEPLFGLPDPEGREDYRSCQLAQDLQTVSYPSKLDAIRGTNGTVESARAYRAWLDYQHVEDGEEKTPEAILADLDGMTLYRRRAVDPKTLMSPGFRNYLAGTSESGRAASVEERRAKAKAWTTRTAQKVYAADGVTLLQTSYLDDDGTAWPAYAVDDVAPEGTADVSHEADDVAKLRAAGKTPKFFFPPAPRRDGATVSPQIAGDAEPEEEKAPAKAKATAKA